MKKKSVNELEKVYSGIFGGRVVLENRKGKIIMVLKTKRARVEASEATRRAQIRFGFASKYAKNILLNPEMRAAYTLKSGKGVSPFQVAMRDYMHSPRVTEIITRDYEGKAGDIIRVSAYDNFAVTQVTVTIQDPDGVVIEKGLCALNPVTNNFDFTAAVTLTSLTGVTIFAQAHDYPGHVGGNSVTL